MSGREKLLQVAHQLSQGDPSPSVTVREFLSWFDALRRGNYIVQSIKEVLKEAKLVTEPDFDSAYIDAPIRFVAVAEEDGAEHKQGDMSGNASSDPGSASTWSYSDPAYRISRLEASTRQPIYVSPDAELHEATTTMLNFGYSQLPVMTNVRDVKGVISWATIGGRFALGMTGRAVRDFMDKSHQEISSDGSIFRAITIIEEHDYVLVRKSDRSIGGIVTASDLRGCFEIKVQRC